MIKIDPISTNPHIEARTFLRKYNFSGENMSDEPQPPSTPGAVSLAIGILGSLISVFVFIDMFKYTGSASMGALGNLMTLMVTVPVSLGFLLVGLIAIASKREK